MTSYKDTNQLNNNFFKDKNTKKLNSLELKLILCKDSKRLGHITRTSEKHRETERL